MPAADGVSRWRKNVKNVILQRGSFKDGAFWGRVRRFLKSICVWPVHRVFWAQSKNHGEGNVSHSHASTGSAREIFPADKISACASELAISRRSARRFLL